MIEINEYYYLAEVAVEPRSCWFIQSSSSDPVMQGATAVVPRIGSQTLNGSI